MSSAFSAIFRFKAFICSLSMVTTSFSLAGSTTDSVYWPILCASYPACGVPELIGDCDTGEVNYFPGATSC